MIIVLIGYMGSGKSAVGRKLAKDTTLNYIDLDDFIVEREGLSIPEIFSLKGEIYFRKKESQYLRELLSSVDDTIVSLGGGTPCYGSNMDIIKEYTSNVFYLKASVATLLDRLGNEKQQRPLIAGIAAEELEEFIRKHLFERNFYYLQANNVISVDQKPIEEIAQEISNMSA